MVPQTKQNQLTVRQDCQGRALHQMFYTRHRDAIAEAAVPWGILCPRQTGPFGGIPLELFAFYGHEAAQKHNPFHAALIPIHTTAAECVFIAVSAAFYVLAHQIGGILVLSGSDGGGCLRLHEAVHPVPGKGSVLNNWQIIAAHAGLCR